MDIHSLAKAAQRPLPFEKGTANMWTDDHISKQLLDFHLNPDIDAASRNFEVIDNTIRWILSVMSQEKLSILDLGCGPGLYAERLAQEGHWVTGVDVSETSIAYAQEQAVKKNIAIEYQRRNYLEIEYENQFDIALLIYCDFCVLDPTERKRVLENIRRALKPGGTFIFDVSNDVNIEQRIAPKTWKVEEKGFWKDRPYIVLSEGFHYPEEKALVKQHVVFDEQGRIEKYIFWTHYYNQGRLNPIIESCGFDGIERYNNVLSANLCENGEYVTFYKVKKST